MSLLRVDGLSVAYETPDGERVLALDDVGFALEAGETLGIVGESGCGKSTLARTLLGHLRPGSRIVSGRVSLDGRDLFALPPSDLRAVRGRVAALVPQQPLSALTPHMRVGAQVGEAVAAHHGGDRRSVAAIALDLMARTRLPDPATLARRYPHAISGGQRQRVVIAAALAGDPRLLVLDEPTTALDKSTEAEVLALVETLRTRLGAALVYVSHDLRVIRAVCRRVLVMRGGRVVEDGPAASVFGNPRTTYARTLVTAVPDLNRSVPPRLRSPVAGPSLLRLDAVGFTYPTGWRPFAMSAPAPALAGVSFAIGRGESFGIVGESGSGKSTLAGLIAGLIHGNTGRILFEGMPLVGHARRRTREMRRRVQLVFQDPASSLNPAHTVRDILVRPMRLLLGLDAAEADRRAARLMEQMELAPALLARRPRELSGGQQQRVALARALGVEPDLLVCDEVTSALDVTVQAHVVAILRRLQEEGRTTFLYISHDLGFVRDVADRVLVLERGRVRECGPTDDVLGRPAHPYTATLVAAYRGAVSPDGGGGPPKLSKAV